MFSNKFFVKAKSNKKLRGLNGADDFQDMRLFQGLPRVERLAGLLDDR